MLIWYGRAGAAVGFDMHDTQEAVCGCDVAGQFFGARGLEIGRGAGRRSIAWRLLRLGRPLEERRSAGGREGPLEVDRVKPAGQRDGGLLLSLAGWYFEYFHAVYSELRRAGADLEHVVPVPRGAQPCAPAHGGGIGQR